MSKLIIYTGAVLALILAAVGAVRAHAESFGLSHDRSTLRWEDPVGSRGLLFYQYAYGSFKSGSNPHSIGTVVKTSEIGRKLYFGQPRVYRLRRILTNVDKVPWVCVRVGKDASSWPIECPAGDIEVQPDPPPAKPKPVKPAGSIGNFRIDWRRRMMSWTNTHTEDHKVLDFKWWRGDLGEWRPVAANALNVRADGSRREMSLPYGNYRRGMIIFRTVNTRDSFRCARLGGGYYAVGIPQCPAEFSDAKVIEVQPDPLPALLAAKPIISGSDDDGTLTVDIEDGTATFAVRAPDGTEGEHRLRFEGGRLVAIPDPLVLVGDVWTTVSIAAGAGESLEILLTPVEGGIRATVQARVVELVIPAPPSEGEEQKPADELEGEELEEHLEVLRRTLRRYRSDTAPALRIE